MTLSEKQNAMIAEINRLGDCFEQYSYLLVKSQELPSICTLVKRLFLVANLKCGFLSEPYMGESILMQILIR